MATEAPKQDAPTFTAQVFADRDPEAVPTADELANATNTELNNFIRDKIEHWHEQDLTDYDLWMDFKEGFANWEYNTFYAIKNGQLSALKKALLKGGVFLGCYVQGKLVSVSQAIYDSLKLDEFHDYTFDEAKV